MTDDTRPGLGWIESPPDDRDWHVADLYAATGTAAPDALPSAYHVPAPLYPVTDQGASPMCVAYSAAGEQGWYDLRDTGLALFDETLFFSQIGGTPSGAVIRDALARRLSAGYPSRATPSSRAGTGSPRTTPSRSRRPTCAPRSSRSGRWCSARRGPTRGSGPAATARSRRSTTPSAATPSWRSAGTRPACGSATRGAPTGARPARPRSRGASSPTSARRGRPSTSSSPSP
jgi:hypothetical protein